MIINLDGFDLIKSTAKKDLPDGGVWRTIRGRKVYIKDGQIIAGNVPGVTSTKKLDAKGDSGHGRPKQKAGDGEREVGRGAEGARGGASEGRKDGSGNQGDIRSVRGIKKTYEATSDDQYTYHEMSGADASKAFHSAISAAKKGNAFGAFVHAYEQKEYEDMSLYLSDGGEAGMAITKTGDIVSVFNNPKTGTKKGVARHLLDMALQNGGKKLDCFDGFLPKLYAKYGFVPVARMKFAREYAPEGWNFERDGEPDVLFFAHNGDSIEKVRSSSYPPVDLSKVPYITDYDDGARLQKEYEETRAGALTKSLFYLQDFMRGYHRVT